MQPKQENKIFKNQQFYEFISHEEHENVQENGLQNSFFVCKHLKKDFFQWKLLEKVMNLQHSKCLLLAN